MTAAVQSASPSFNDLFVAADIVDTLRNNDKLIDQELGADDRKKALRAKLREMYQAQGMDVSEKLIDEAISKMDADRFVFHPMPAGLNRSLASIYIQRGKYTKIFAAVICIFVAAFNLWRAGEYYYIEKPRAEAQRALELQLAEVLPTRLKAATTKAVDTANRLKDYASLGEAVDLSTKAMSAIKVRNTDEAKQLIGRIELLAVNLAKAETAQQTAEANQKLVDITRKRVSDAQAQIASANLTAEARRALGDQLNEITAAATRGDASGVDAANLTYDNLFRFISTPYTIQIVNRDGVKTGFWRMYKPTGKKNFYLVVEAIGPNGRPATVSIKNFESGIQSDVKTWAISVPESLFNRVASEKKSTGSIANDKAGQKDAGALSITYSIPTIDNQTITKW